MKYLLMLFVLLTAGCGPQAKGPETLTIITHDSFAATDTVIHDFEQGNSATLSFVKGGDAGAALNKVILTKAAPLADVFYGVDNTFLSRALAAGIYQAYDAPALSAIPAAFKLDPTDQALPVDYGDVCINFDKGYFAAHELAVPASLEQLGDEKYRGLLVTENPASSSPGLVFLLATIKHFGDPGYLGYWRSLRANGLVVVDGWETAYYTNFSGSSGHGAQPMVVSYASSPPAEVMFASSPLQDAPTASITGPDMCFRQIEFVGVLQGTQHPSLARKFVDFMLSKEFQQDMPAQMFVYPVIPGISLPEAFVKYAQVPSEPATLAPQEIAQNRDRWIQAWTDAVLH
jgi:thiamine transport system substrate-binding protein